MRVEHALHRRAAPVRRRPAARARPPDPATAGGSRQSRARCPTCRGTRPSSSDSAVNSSSAPTWTPSAASEVAGVGVPSGAATTLMPMPTTTASASSADRLRFQQDAGELARRRPARRWAISAKSSYRPIPPRAAMPRCSPAQRRLQRQPRGKAERRRNRGRHHRSPRGCCWRGCHAARSTRDCAGRGPPSAPSSRTTSARARRRAPAPWPRHWSSRSYRTRRAGNPPRWLADRARMPSRTATSPQPSPR